MDRLTAAVPITLIVLILPITLILLASLVSLRLIFASIDRIEKTLLDGNRRRPAEEIVHWIRILSTFLRRVSLLAVVATAFTAVLSLIGFDTTPVWKPIVIWVAGPGLRLILIVAGSIVLVRVAYIAIARMEKLVEDEDPDHVSEREKRARTLGTVLRKATVITVAVVAILTVLGQLGVDTTPIITAAGIGGLAVGFGAQNLVRDIISGFFIIMENQLRVGDVVKINDVGGLVEDITLRTTVLRDLEGVVHIIPNGTIERVSNMTKEWSRAVITVGVAYKEDVDRVMEVLEDIGRELAEDGSFGPSILEPMNILGVDDFGASSVDIKLMITTKPLKQWEIGRELRRRIKNRFDHEGIEIPFPHLSLYWGEASKPMDINPGVTSASRRPEHGNAE